VKKGNAKIVPSNPDALFLLYQERWIRDTSRLKLMEKARQIGLSWSTAYPTVERTAKAGARWDQWISSRDEIQARLFLDDCKMWTKVFQLAAEDLGEVVVDAAKRLTALALRFASGRSTRTPRRASAAGACSTSSPCWGIRARCGPSPIRA